MLNRVVLKNPGCPFCRYYLPPFRHEGQMTTEACLKGARRIYQQRRTKKRQRRWKWVDCAYASEKNKHRTCPDFRIQSLTVKLIHQLALTLRGADRQDPPAFSREIWWET